MGNDIVGLQFVDPAVPPARIGVARRNMLSSGLKRRCPFHRVFQRPVKYPFYLVGQLLPKWAQYLLRLKCSVCFLFTKKNVM